MSISCRRLVRLSLLLLLALLLQTPFHQQVAAAPDDTPPPPPPSSPSPSPPRVLLIGNELLASSNLTHLLESLLQANQWGTTATPATTTSPKKTMTDTNDDNKESTEPKPTPTPAPMPKTKRANYVTTRFDSGYSLGPNPFAPDFNRENYESLTPAIDKFEDGDQQNEFTADEVYADTTPSSITEARSRVPLYNRLKSVSRTNAQALDQLTPTTPIPATTKKIDALWSEAIYRHTFPSKTASIEWEPYDTERRSRRYRGFHGTPSEDRGIAVFQKKQQHSMELTVAAENPTAPPSPPPPPPSPSQWPRTLPQTLTLSLWVLLNDIALDGNDAIFDCRSASPEPPSSDAGSNADSNAGSNNADSNAGSKPDHPTPAPLSTYSIQLLPKRSSKGSIDYMYFAYTGPVNTNAAQSGAAEGTPATNTATTTVDTVNYIAAIPSGAATSILKKGVWQLWTITVDSTGALAMYCDGELVSSARHPLPNDGAITPSQVDTELGVTFPSSRMFPLPSAERTRCVIGKNLDTTTTPVATGTTPAAAPAAAGSFDGKIADLILFDRVLTPDEIRVLYYQGRPSSITFLSPPPVVNYQQVSGTKMAHAFSPDTLKLFDTALQPEPWSHVILQDHVIAPYIAWWQRHSFIPGLLILAKHIWRHSPDATILVAQTWPHDRTMQDITVPSLTGNKDESDSSGAFFGASDGWTTEAAVERTHSYYCRALDFILADSSNLADLPDDYHIPSLAPSGGSGNAKLKLLPLGDVMQTIADQTVQQPWTTPPIAGQGDQAGEGKKDKDKEGEGEAASSQSQSRPIGMETLFKTPSIEPTDADADTKSDGARAQLHAAPSPIGAFTNALTIFVELTNQAIECATTPSSSSGNGSGSGGSSTAAPSLDPIRCPATFYCPCSLTPPSLLTTARSKSETATDTSARLQAQGELCAVVRNGVQQAMATVRTKPFQSPPNEVIPIMDDHTLCGFDCMSEKDDGCPVDPSTPSSSSPPPSSPPPSSPPSSTTEGDNSDHGSDGDDSSETENENPNETPNTNTNPLTPGESSGDNENANAPPPTSPPPTPTPAPTSPPTSAPPPPTTPTTKEEPTTTNAEMSSTEATPSPLTPLIVVTILLVVSILTGVICYWYRSKRHQWQLLSDRGYDDTDRQLEDIEEV